MRQVIPMKMLITHTYILQGIDNKIIIILSEPVIIIKLSARVEIKISSDSIVHFYFSVKYFLILSINCL